MQARFPSTFTRKWVNIDSHTVVTGECTPILLAYELVGLFLNDRGQDPRVSCCYTKLQTPTVKQNSNSNKMPQKGLICIFITIPSLPSKVESIDSRGKACSNDYLLKVSTFRPETVTIAWKVVR